MVLERSRWVRDIFSGKIKNLAKPSSPNSLLESINADKVVLLCRDIARVTIPLLFIQFSFNERRVRVVFSRIIVANNPMPSSLIPTPYCTGRFQNKNGVNTV
eukprot:TRINITY_DN9300_c0_g1_i4.p1 TRINITY_DN9300_c0_g1~~TRINITY_DN9300_c0_g1_i4.p1  ORF type:complete len:102 (+),score=6.68 TRINITY_DN9300_c0_g1_i4:107-412(+)